MLRWADYLFFKNDSFNDFWKQHMVKKKDILLVLGEGFDPRMCLCTEVIMANPIRGCRDVVLIRFDEDKFSPSAKYEHEIQQNRSKLETLVGDAGTIQVKTIPLKANDGYRIGPRKAADIFQNSGELEKYSDIIIDISSMPLDIYMPLIGKTLHLLESNSCINLHIVVAEDTLVDTAIKESDLADKASYLHGFTGDLNNVARDDEPMIWIPVLGENSQIQMEQIENHVSAKEICPVLPFPSRNPRRGDDLMLEHRKFMNYHDIEIRNIIYVSEQNPFDAYREIYRVIQSYRRSFSPLGKCRVAISTLSNKLVSLGVFLVAYEEGIQNNEKVGVAYVAADGYNMNRKMIGQWNRSSTQLFSLWIAGDCYE